MGIIYGLIDAETGELRYVGQTKQLLKSRLSYHNYIARNKLSKSYLYNWMSSLLEKNIHIDVILLEDNCDDTDFWEIFYIQYFKSIGCRLTNLSPGGKSRGGFKHTQEHKDMISAKFKGRKPWNTGLKLTKEQKKNKKPSLNFLHLSEESMNKRVAGQVKTKSTNSKVSDETIKFIRAVAHSYRQWELAEMLELRQDYISDVVNYKIRKHI